MSSAAPFSLSASTWLGFDLDHTLCRYDLSTFGPLVFGLVVRHLVVHQRCSPALLDVPFDASYAGKGVAFDSVTGNSIKLGADGRVRVAVHGFDRLSQQRIAAAYPAPLAHIDDDKRFLVVHSSFEACSIYILAHLVTMLDAGTLFSPDRAPAASPTPSSSSSPYQQLVPALFAAFEFEFGSWQRGGYFAALRANVGRYVHSRPEVRQWLTRIREAGRHGLFLVTNSRYDCAELLLRHVLGDDWQRLFDFVVCDAGKPTFFSDATRPFYPLDEQSLAADTLRPLPVDGLLPPGCILIHGNAAQLTRSLRAVRPQCTAIVYFDDHVRSAIVPIRQLCTEWQAGAVVEELATSPAQLRARSSHRHNQYHGPATCDLFGHALIAQPGADDDPSHWAHTLHTTAHFSLPCLSDLIEST